jgi:hypothetical protein
MWQFPNGTDNYNANDGTWICAPPNCMIMKQTTDAETGDATEFYTVDPNLEAYITVSGFYRLHVKVRKYKVSIAQGEVESETPIGEGYNYDGTLKETGTVKGDSPFEFYVLPAPSDTSNSGLNAATPSEEGETTGTTAGRRHLLAAGGRRRARALLHDMSDSFTPDTATPEQAHHEVGAVQVEGSRPIAPESAWLQPLTLPLDPV